MMITIAIGFIPLSPLSIVSTMVVWQGSQWLGKNDCAEYWLKEIKESMDRCTGCLDKTKITLKTALNTIQSINQSYTTPKEKAFGKDVGTILVTRIPISNGFFQEAFAHREDLRGSAIL